MTSKRKAVMLFVFQNYCANEIKVAMHSCPGSGESCGWSTAKILTNYVAKFLGTAHRGYELLTDKV